MTAPSRIYSAVREIDYEATRRFWGHRASLVNTLDALNVTMLQDNDPELARRRDQHEQDTIFPYLSLTPESKVLDIGCGTGRWAYKLKGLVGSYHGVDFSDELIEVGRRGFVNDGMTDQFTLQAISATDASAQNLDVEGPFDVIIISDMLLYLNDDDVKMVLENIASMTSSAGVFYLREPVAYDERLTLDKHFSDVLKDDYSAVYRTADFYEKLFSDVLAPCGFDLVASDFLYPQLTNRKETSQYFWINERK